MTSIRHIGLVVADLERSIKFYSNVFGFKLVSRAVETGSFIETLVGLPEVCIEWAKLTDTNGIILEMLYYHSHQDKPSMPSPARHGCSHAALTVSNIDESVRKLIDAGGTSGTIQQNPENTVKVVYARDPEGIILELVEELKK